MVSNQVIYIFTFHRGANFIWWLWERWFYLSWREIRMDDPDSDVFTFQFIIEFLCSFFALYKDQYRWIQTLLPSRKRITKGTKLTLDHTVKISKLTSAKLWRRARSFPSSVPAKTSFCLTFSDAVFLYGIIKDEILLLQEMLWSIYNKLQYHVFYTHFWPMITRTASCIMERASSSTESGKVALNNERMIEGFEQALTTQSICFNKLCSNNLSDSSRTRYSTLYSTEVKMNMGTTQIEIRMFIFLYMLLTYLLKSIFLALIALCSRIGVDMRTSHRSFEKSAVLTRGLVINLMWNLLPLISFFPSLAVWAASSRAGERITALIPSVEGR